MDITSDVLGGGRERPARGEVRVRKVALAAALIGALLLLIALPLLMTDLPPLLDYPNHLARSYILQNWATDPMLQHWYRITWRPIPDLGHDMLMAAMTPFLDVEIAGRILLGAIQAVTLTGVVALHRALWRRWSLWPLAAVPFLWHGAFTAGFTSFSLGVGLALWGAALWILLAGWPLATRLAAGVALAISIYLTHVFALCCFLAMIGSFELWQLLTAPKGTRFASAARSALLISGALLLPVALFVMLQTTTQGDGLWGEWKWASRVRGLQMPLMGEFRDVRLALSGAVAALAVLLVATRSLRAAWCMAPAMLVLVVLFLVLPGMILSNGAVPERIAVLMALLAVAATDFRPRSRWLGRTVAATVALCAVLQSASVALAWHQAKGWTDGMRQAVLRIPPGSSLLVAQPWARADVRHPFMTARDRVPGWYFSLNDFPALMHMTSLAIRRDVFIPLLFSHPQKQILSFAPGFGREQGKPFGVDEALLPDARPGGPIVGADFRQYDSMIVLYAELLSPRQRALLESLNPTYDDGRIMIVPLR